MIRSDLLRVVHLTKHGQMGRIGPWPSGVQGRCRSPGGTAPGHRKVPTDAGAGPWLTVICWRLAKLMVTSAVSNTPSRSRRLRSSQAPPLIELQTAQGEVTGIWTRKVITEGPPAR